MFLENLLNCFKTRIKLGRKNYKEVSELIQDLRNNLNYKNIKLDIIDKNNVSVTAKENSDCIKIDMNFLTNEMIQKTNTKRTILMPFLNKAENTQIVTGTIDGKIKSVKTIENRYDSHGNFHEVTNIENPISGNTYRRIRTPEGNTYQKLVNHNYINLFNI